MEEKLSCREARAELRRARRINACLNKAIRLALMSNEWKKVAHWQQISMTYYEVDDEEKQKVLQGKRTTKDI